MCACQFFCFSTENVMFLWLWGSLNAALRERKGITMWWPFINSFWDPNLCISVCCFVTLLPKRSACTWWQDYIVFVTPCMKKKCMSSEFWFCYKYISLYSYAQPSMMLLNTEVLETWDSDVFENIHWYADKFVTYCFIICWKMEGRMQLTSQLCFTISIMRMHFLPSFLTLQFNIEWANPSYPLDQRGHRQIMVWVGP